MILPAARELGADVLSSLPTPATAAGALRQRPGLPMQNDSGVPRRPPPRGGIGPSTSVAFGRIVKGPDARCQL